MLGEIAMALNQRAELLLKTLIERYITDGQPVGSRTLAKETRLDLSPATVRNVMADLEEMGLVESPHTSAGRVPTQRAYRLFVDTLINVRPLDAEALQVIEQRLKEERDPQQLLETASSLLSEVTHLAGLVMLPRRALITLRQLDFVPLSRGRVLVILVTQDGRVQNRVIAADQNYRPAELVEAANYFNATYSGVSLDEVKGALLRELEADGEAMQALTASALAMARQMFPEDDEPEDDLLVSGESNLFDIPRWSDINKLRELFDAFKTKQDLLHLLDKSLKASGLQIFIGSESGYHALHDCSVVAAPYTVDGKVVGTLGVVGPTRMAYGDVIPIVDITARLLGSALQA